MSKNYFAAIDLGTNSFHLIIVKVNEDGSFEVVDREREVIRLGAHEGKDLSYISPDEIKKAIEVLSRFQKLAKSYKAKISAIATSAVREAGNKNQFISEVFTKTGIEVEVIDGRREAELIFLGAKKALSLSDKKVLCFDIGGGSTEIILGNNGKTDFAESIKVGAVRLSKKFFPDYNLSDQSIRQCEEYVEHQITSNKKIKLEESFDFAVGASGTIQSAASMIRFRSEGKSKKSLNGYSFDSMLLKEITSEILSARTIDERAKIKGIEIKRADILPAGLIILNKIFDIFRLKSMTVSDYALREGIVIRMIDEEKKVR